MHLSHPWQQAQKASNRQGAAGHGGQPRKKGPTSLPGAQAGGRGKKGRRGPSQASLTLGQARATPEPAARGEKMGPVSVPPNPSG